MFVFVFAVSLALIVSFLCSLAEATLLSLPEARIEALAAKGRRAGAILQRFRRKPDIPIAAILTLNTVAHTAGATIAGASFATAFGGDVNDSWFIVSFTVVTLLFTEIVPKTMGVAYANSLATPVALMVDFLIIVLRPVIYLTRQFSRLVGSGKEQSDASLEEIRIMAMSGRARGAFGDLTAGIIANATRLREIKVRDVMLPRHKVQFLSGQKSFQENFERIKATGHSRFPFTPTNDLDDTSGIVLAKKVLYHLPEGPPSWDGLLNKPLIFPESVPLTRALQVFQGAQRHLALVVDEFGIVQGIITLEDVLEEIVGEIVDEFDPDHDEGFVDLGEGTLVSRGSVEVRKLLQHLGVEDVPTISQTVSGFLTEQHGSLPAAGTELRWSDLVFQVTKASDRQVLRVRITKAAENNRR